MCAANESLHCLTTIRRSIDKRKRTSIALGPIGLWPIPLRTHLSDKRGVGMVAVLADFLTQSGVDACPDGTRFTNHLISQHGPMSVAGLHPE